ncbi:phosphate ABC transporter permease subunit PstC [Rhizobium sp. BK251]|uniref:phosphate ABC transporter permease subunit PstC n=1 Tax=Rhizobium sp. BK251 TaxID=2512125 RepID=UPI00104D1A40|nr:phosphate ABC transporter permease subunit PstC [Rhizobium sp. BK251]TCL70368.1 phosphate ABC transporter membrane protein 1 (PhoT family) [Rhizobium sp. BK251]
MSEALAPNSPQARGAGRRRSTTAFGDRIFHWIVLVCGLFVLAALLAAALSMAWGGMLAFRTFGLGFVYGTEWDPVAGVFAALVPIYGTLVTSALAMLIGVPISLGVAVFVTEVAPRWLRGPIGGAIELLAGVPSIIYGMWGLFSFAPVMSDYVQPFLIDWLGPLPFIGALFSGAPLGIGMLTSGTVLAIMIIPYISSVMRDVFLVVPPQLKESAYALGSTRWEVVRDIVIPHTRTAVVGGIFLGLGRALGETMAVTFVLGNTHNIAISLMEPGNSIAAAIANEFTEADTDVYLSSLIALGFILFVVTFIVLAAAKVMLLRIARQRGE